MKSTFPVKSQRNWGLKVYLFSMGKACKREGYSLVCLPSQQTILLIINHLSRSTCSTINRLTINSYRLCHTSHRRNI